MFGVFAKIADLNMLWATVPWHHIRKSTRQIGTKGEDFSVKSMLWRLSSGQVSRSPSRQNEGF
jgi:hypothetical protein